METKNTLGQSCISLMAMGGSYGTGIFKGSGETVGVAGPGACCLYF
ncbi:hypothetical protein AB9M62_00045 [Bacillales bacterium AN1005]